MSIKGKPVSAVTATVLVACSLLIPSVANASQESLDRGDFSIACHQQHGWSWFPQHFGGGAYGWKCTNFFHKKADISVQRYCRSAYGADAKLRNAADPYGWYCA
ncbi:hypothetical protein HG436_004195 [Candidatus Saccharibacteria bacterium]|mgnify:FL=1|jgi:lipoprotein|nr:hypothetical protein [Candidatus Saccharibacteria bacterium]